MKKYIILPLKDINGKYQKAMDIFIDPFISYLENGLADYEIIIVEQKGGSLKDTLPERYKDLLTPELREYEFFNLGRTINIGFDIFRKDMKEEDIFMFYPVDLLPINPDFEVSKTTKFCYSLHSPEGTFYKAIAFLFTDYVKINGFSNELWGWGLDDNNLFVRIGRNSISTDVKIDEYERITNDGNGLTDEQHFMPLYGYNQRYINDTETGLNNLSYELLSIENYKGIKKYIIR